MSSPRRGKSDAHSRYICEECGHGENLEAIACANVSGPLAADGELAAHVSSEECYVYEDSIACTEHGDCVSILKLIDGHYHRWVPCERCRDRDGKRYRQGNISGYNPPCPDCHGKMGRDVRVEAVSA